MNATPAGLLTVSQVTRLVKQAINRALPGTLTVVGQLGNFKRHTSGHLYFTLKDEGGELSCVMWRSDATSLKFAPSDGLEVIVTGQIDVFERSGRYQLYVRRMEPRGIGALELAFQQMRDKLAAEGLFDPARKRPIPRFPRRIAVVTSETGAALHDIRTTIERRFPCVELLVCPVAVQGPGAAEQIAATIRRINVRAAALGGIDVMLVGRGGGSLEDLWAFNEEIVARAIFASAIPIVSAVGHEVDVTVADLVADVRAATPTAAAELVVPVRSEVLIDLSKRAARLQRSLGHRLSLATGRIAAVAQRSALRQPLLIVLQREQYLDRLSAVTGEGLARRMNQAHAALARCEQALRRIEPRQLLLQRSRQSGDQMQRLSWLMFKRLSRIERDLADRQQRLTGLSPARRLAVLGERLDRIRGRYASASQHRLGLASQHLDALHTRLDATSYQATLRRGYSITRRKKDRAIVREPGQAHAGEVLVTETYGGGLESRVVDRNQPELFE